MKKLLLTFGVMLCGAVIGFVATYANWKVGVAALVTAILAYNLVGLVVLKRQETRTKSYAANQPPRIV